MTGASPEQTLGRDLSTGAMTGESAAVVIQRHYRDVRARQSPESAGPAAIARILALHLSTALTRALSELMLLPFSLASQAVVRAKFNHLLDVIVRDYDRKRALKVASNGIRISGRDGLHLDNDAVAALQGGATAYTDVWVSQVDIKVPVLLGRPIEIEVRALTFSWTSEPHVLSSSRLASLQRVLGTAGREKSFGPSAEADAGAAPAQAGAGEGQPAIGPGERSPSLHARAREAAEGGVANAGYTQRQRALDGVVIRIGRMRVDMPALTLPGDTSGSSHVASSGAAGWSPWFGAHESAQGVGCARSAALGALGAGAARAMMAPVQRGDDDSSASVISCGGRVACAVRWPRAWRRDSRGEHAAQSLETISPAAVPPELRMAPPASTTLTFRHVELGNATPAFAPSDRLVVVKAAKRPAAEPSAAERWLAEGVAGVARHTDAWIGGLSSGWRDLLEWARSRAAVARTGREEIARDATPSPAASEHSGRQRRAPTRRRASSDSEGAEAHVHVFKRLTARACSADATIANGVRVPLLQPHACALHVRLTRGLRTGRLAALDVEAIGPEAPLALLVDASQGTRGTLCWRTAADPINAPGSAHIGAGRSSIIGDALASTSTAGSGAAADRARDEWWQQAELAAALADSFDADDARIRTALDARPTEDALRGSRARSGGKPWRALVPAASGVTDAYASPAGAGKAGMLALSRAPSADSIESPPPTSSSTSSESTASSAADSPSSAPETIGEVLWRHPDAARRVHLSHADLRALLQTHGVPLEEREMRVLAARLDPACTGRIALRDFLRAFVPEETWRSEHARARTCVPHS